MSASVLAEWALFLALSAMALGGAAMMLLTMSMYRAGLFLMVSFLALAGMFFLLQADLLAVIQIMMNVGGMLVMILFMVMLMMDPGGEMMWDMKRQMKLPGPGAFSMSMPRGKPPTTGEHVPQSEHRHSPTAGETQYTCPMHPEVVTDEPGPCPKCGMDLVPVQDPTVAGPAEPPREEQEAAGEYTCPMHPEVRSDQPGPCPKCGMDLVPVENGSPTTASEGDTASMHGGHAMSPAAHHQMMVDMAMSTEQLPWALGIGLLSGGSLAALAAWTPWPTAPQGPIGDAAAAVGELLLSRYMIAFEGAAMLILAGIAGGVILGRREGSPSRAGSDSADGAVVHPHDGEVAMEHTNGQQSQGASGVWTCPMHPEVRSNEAGKCPKCGMDLVPAESLSDRGGSAAK